MTNSLSESEIEKTLKGIVIPPRPQVLVKLGAEMKRDDPDPRVVVSLLSADVGLAAAMLKTINSPFFGRSSKISSVASAVGLMGMKMTNQLITGLVLKNAVAGEVRSLERFWDSAEKVAGIASFIAMKLPGVSRDDAYSFGLFRDIGIPILMGKFPDYRITGRHWACSMQPLTNARRISRMSGTPPTTQRLAIWLPKAGFFRPRSARPSAFTMT